MEENEDAPLLGADAVRHFAGKWLRWLHQHLSKSVTELLQAPPEDTRFSVLLAETHAGLPPAVVQVSALDPLRDEGILYEKVLKNAGVNTRLHV